jgi:uncharacterized protein YgbK (DUF1537 family)
MSLALGCIADDYTGASDLANTLAKAGLATVQAIGIPADDLALPPADAVVVSLKIRSVAAGEAVAKARAADAWLRSRGASHVLYKICSTFDSTDAGNIGPVAHALRFDHGDPVVLVTPAFPETGRTVYQGNLFVGRLPLDESPLKDHPLNPMRDADLTRVLARQSRAPVGLLDLATVARGVGAVRERLAVLAAEGAGMAIADAVFERDLETLGLAALDARVSVGASGLGLGLARALVAAGRGGGRSVAAGQGRSATGGAALCLAGSCSQATLAQVAAAEAAMPVLRLDVGQLVAGSEEIERAIAWARARLADGPVLVATSAAPADVARIQAEHGRQTAGHRIEQALATIAETLVATAGVDRLVVAGGETSGAVVDRLGIPAFAIGPEIAPGVPVLAAVGGAHAGMALALKSGNFGGRDFFSDALALMR